MYIIVIYRLYIDSFPFKKNISIVSNIKIHKNTWMKIIRM